MAILRFGARQRAMREVAKAHGLRYSEDDEFGIAAIRFALWGPARATLENVLTATAGVAIHGFDALAGAPAKFSTTAARSGLGGWSPSGAGPVSNQAGEYQYSCAMTTVDANLPSVRIVHKPWLVKALDRHPTDWGSEAFDKLFVVEHHGDVEGARAVLGPDVIEMLVGTRGKIGFEVHGNGLLCWTAKPVPPSEVPGLMAVIERFAAALDPEVLASHPAGALSADGEVLASETDAGRPEFERSFEVRHPTTDGLRRVPDRLQLNDLDTDAMIDRLVREEGAPDDPEGFTS